jgi:biopolymer transport protein ExbD
MALKRKNKISALFNMSSLTDIIFLLLIFFMLTSALVAPNALNLKLPGAANKTSEVPKKIDRVIVDKGGTLFLNGKLIAADRLEMVLRERSRELGEPMNIAIKPNPNVEIEHVVLVMDIAMRLEINAILDVPQQKN